METGRFVVLHRALSIRVVRFGLVGIINTLVDFTILNVLVFVVGLDKLPANIVSVSCAMLVSYALNHSFVFRSDDQEHAKRFVPFAVITMFGLFVIQNVVIYVMVHAVTLPAELLYNIQNALGMDFSKEFITLNTAKVAATAATMIWNYTMYKQVVFRNTPQQSTTDSNDT